MRPIRVAVVCVLAEERWPSMDLVGDRMLEHLEAESGGEVVAERIRPPARLRFARVPVSGRDGLKRNADRLANRYWDYPRALRAIVRNGRFDLYHLVDHSYSQLLHEVPTGRGIVTCHDLDTFRCLLRPEQEPRPAWFKRLTARTLKGFRTAAFVPCNSEQTRRQILEHGIIPEQRLEVLPMGIHAECGPGPDPEADAELSAMLGPRPGPDAPELLHVGSNIPRKRIDILMRVFAGVRERFPSARLLKVGGAFEGAHADLARDLGISGAIVTLPFATNRALASLYRRADLVLQPSEAEGFGLPVAEALACGSPLLASDIPALREVAGQGAVYRPVGDVPGWVQAAVSILEGRRDDDPEIAVRRRQGFDQVSRFTWPEHARRLHVVYRRVLDATRSGGH